MRFAPLWILVLATACGPTAPGHSSGDDDSTGDDDAAPVPDAWHSTGPDAATECGNQTQNIGVQNLGDPPDLLIVLDRSGSMSGPIPSFPPTFTPKWNIMRDALEAVANAKQDQIRFGLSEFPTDADCAVDATAVHVPIGLHQAAAITSYFASRSPDGNTPAAAGLGAALTHYNSIPVNDAGRYVLFATDGDPNCSTGDPGAETVAAVTSLASAGIKTFVLGFGGAFSDDTVPNNAAQAGQVPKAGGPPYYYEANSPSELASVLDTIAGGIIVPSCSFALASPPPEPDNVTVTLNGAVVPRSTAHTNGWDYWPDAMTITFFGSYCDQIHSGATTTVDFSYGCPGPVID